MAISLKISLSAIDAMMRSNLEESFLQSLVEISNGVYRPDSSSCEDATAQAALAIIYRESTEAHEKKAMAGRASAMSRLGNSENMHPVIIPEIKVPHELKSITINGIMVHPSVIAKIRYVMLFRGFGAPEYLIFLRHYLRNSGNEISLDELVSHAQSWTNYRRECRFPLCPQFHGFMMQLFDTVSAEERGYLLDSSLDVKIENGEGKIIGCEKALIIFQNHKDIFSRIVKPYFPEIKFITTSTPFR